MSANPKLLEGIRPSFWGLVSKPRDVKEFIQRSEKGVVQRSQLRGVTSANCVQKLQDEIQSPG